jgi:hypothetical protein
MCLPTTEKDCEFAFFWTAGGDKSIRVKEHIKIDLYREMYVFVCYDGQMIGNGLNCLETREKV